MKKLIYSFGLLTLLTAGSSTYVGADVKTELKPVNGIDIEYLDVGKGEPIVFVHGAIGDYRTWLNYMEPLAEGHRAIAYTQRYFGEQDWSDKGENFKISTFTDDLAAFIEALDVGPVHLVTWSYGGTMATAVAVQRPELVKSLVHYEPAGGTTNALFSAEDEEKVKPARDAFYATFGGMSEQLKAGNNDEAARKLTEAVFEMEPGDFAKKIDPSFQKIILTNARTVPLQMTPASKEDTQLTCDYVGKVKAPVLIVSGETTNSYWTQISEKMTACTPGATRAILKGVNHIGPAVAVSEFAGLITEFIDKQR